MQKPTEIETEILIIGGGIAGCIAATSLAPYFNITIVDKLTAPIEKAGESLAPPTQRILKKLNLLINEPEEIQQNIYVNSLGMQSYWGSDVVQFVDHIRNPDGAAKSIDRQQFELYLRDSAAKKGAKCLWGCRLQESHYENAQWQIIVKSDEPKNRKAYQINAKFVIDASGRNSHFARTIGISRTHLDQLISCWISFPNTTINSMSTITSDALGWWYSAITPHNKRVLSFQTDADLVPKSSFKNLDAFLDLITSNQLMQSYVQEVSKQDIQFHGTVSANSTKLNQVSGKQWVAIGDAAISFDPLSSQGMFNAMATAMQFTDLLVQAKNALFSWETLDFTSNYTLQITNIWNHYLAHKKLFYGAEQRWPEAPFWQRRHGF